MIRIPRIRRKVMKNRKMKKVKRNQKTKTPRKKRN